MKLSVSDIATLSNLLDQALEMPEAERGAWLSGLSAQHAPLLPRLHEMLAERSGVDDDLGRFPPLDARADGDIVAAGEQVGPYRVLHQIGRGGMGSVWLAERADGTLRRRIALKLPRIAWADGLARRMAREREIGARLEHPNIARLYDAGVDQRGWPYLAFEYIDGVPIDQWCRDRQLSVRQRVQLVVSVARAVAYAHARLVVHRDIKPSNVLVSADGTARLLDFGIAKLVNDGGTEDGDLTRTQGRVLTLRCASPEQVRDDPITVASDVYSLGVLAYELLAGVTPFKPKRETAAALEESILQGDAAPVSSRAPADIAKALKGDIDAIIAKAMKVEPLDRYASAEAFADDLQRHLDRKPVHARPDGMWYRWQRLLARHRVAFAAGALVAVAVVGGMGSALYQAHRANVVAGRERVVRDFVAEVFRISGQQQGHKARVDAPQSVVERAAFLIEQRFVGQHELQAELYGVVGGVFADMGAYGQAADYTERQAKLLEHGPKQARVRSLIALAEALKNDGRLQKAEAPAQHVLEIEPNPSEERLQARLLLAEVVGQLGRLPLAAEHLAAVEAAKIDSPLLQARAMGVRGELLRWQNRPEEYFAVTKQAIDLAMSAQGPDSPVAVDLRLAMSYRMSITLDPAQQAEAQQHHRNAVDVLQGLGGAHAIRAAMARAWWTRVQGGGATRKPAAEALAELEAVRRELENSRTAVPPWYHAKLDYMVATLLLRDGSLARGLPLLESSLDAVLANEGVALLRVVALRVLGTALMHAGRHDEADQVNRKTRAARDSAGAGRHPYAALDHIRVAENLSMTGRFDDALQVLDAAPKFERIRTEGAVFPERYARSIQWTRARVLFDRGDRAQALRLLEANPATDGDEFENDVYQFNALLGPVLCSIGRSGEGYRRLQLALASPSASMDDPHAPWNAHLHAIAGHCALEEGDRATALQHAARARAAFEAQPKVSSYYKQPLRGLEAALGLRLPAMAE